MLTREYRIKMTAYGIDRERYNELNARCKRYPKKRMQADALLGASSPSMSGMPHGGGISDPTAQAAEKRDRLLSWCEPFERAAKTAAHGTFADALIKNCCYGCGYEHLDPSILPTSNRNAFFQARREFFWLLDNFLGDGVS